MTHSELLSTLKDPDEISKNPFKVLKGISSFVNDKNNENIGRELVLRALNQQQHFKGCSEILLSLTREVGLFPYLNPNTLSLRDLIAYEFHKPSYDSNFVFHREQAYIYRKIVSGESVVLSAPTSFGKSRIIDEVVALKTFNNIAIIVPTIALIDETRKRLSVFKENYKIITQVGQSPSPQRNLFIFTAERAMAYGKMPRINFFVIDEFYKLDSFQEDQTRTINLNQTFYKLLKDGGQFLLLGPNIENIPEEIEDKYRCYFYPTKFTTVASDQIYVGTEHSKEARLLDICSSINGQTLIYCKSPKNVNNIARLLSDSFQDLNKRELLDASAWIAKHYHPQWIFGESLKKGIGIHHGRLPRSLGQYVVKLFNEQTIKFLICTSTLIEGVNTKAKNVIIFDNKIATKKFDFFTFNNIKGRSGRMFEHFIGKVYMFDNPPQEKLPFVDMPIATQNQNTPESLLIQLSPEDLTEYSKSRIEPYTTQTTLPLAIIKQNPGIEPSDQIDIAKEIIKDNKYYNLQWSGFPTGPQLYYACGLIWTHFVNNNDKSGVFSGKQLAKKLQLLAEKSSTPSRIKSELMGEYAANSVDDAVERVLQFDRNWASYNFPRYLMALSRIQHHVLSVKHIKPGDYSFYAAKVESLFNNPIIHPLDEFGIPPALGHKLTHLYTFPDNIDDSIAFLRSINIDASKFSKFELTLLNDAIHSL